MKIVHYETLKGLFTLSKIIITIRFVIDVKVSAIKMNYLNFVHGTLLMFRFSELIDAQ